MDNGLAFFKGFLVYGFKFEEFFEFFGGAAHDALGDGTDLDDSTGFERAFDTSNADSQKTAMLLNSGGGAGVDKQTAFAGRVKQPALAVTQAAFGQKERAEFFPGGEPLNDIFFAPIGENDLTASLSGNANSLNLRGHAPVEKTEPA